MVTSMRGPNPSPVLLAFLACLLAASSSRAACPVGCVGTATAAEYRAGLVTWRQKAKDERSAHETTRERLKVATASAALWRGELEITRAKGEDQVSRTTLTWVAAGAALAGLGLGAAGAGAGLDGPARDGVVGGGLGAAAVGAVIAAVTLLLTP